MQHNRKSGRDHVIALNVTTFIEARASQKLKRGVAEFHLCSTKPDISSST